MTGHHFYTKSTAKTPKTFIISLDKLYPKRNKLVESEKIWALYVVFITYRKLFLKSDVSKGMGIIYFLLLVSYLRILNDPRLCWYHYWFFSFGGKIDQYILKELVLLLLTAQNITFLTFKKDIHSEKFKNLKTQ